MSDVFISYARSTEVAAQRIAARLREAGHDVWRDDELPPHLPYADVIEARLRAAKAVVVIWSADAVKSHWVRAEADLAREAGTLVQVSIDGTTPPMPFNQIQCAQLGAPGAAGAPDWGKVLASVDALKQRGQPSTLAAAARAPAREAAMPAREAAAPGRAIVYVPPFIDLAPTGTEDFLAEGLREDVIEALSRHSSLTVRAARDSETETAKSYRLETQVRRVGSRVRISARLIGVADGEPIWSERFDDAGDDPFDLQDRVAMSISANIESAIRREQIRAVPTITGTGTPTEDVYLNAVKLINLAELSGYFRALELLARVVEARPDHASAWAATALAHASIWMDGTETGDHRAAGVAAAQRSLSITEFGLARDRAGQRRARLSRGAGRGRARADRPGRRAQPQLCGRLVLERHDPPDRRRSRHLHRRSRHGDAARPADVDAAAGARLYRRRARAGGPSRRGCGGAQPGAPPAAAGAVGGAVPRREPRPRRAARRGARDAGAMRRGRTARPLPLPAAPARTPPIPCRRPATRCEATPGGPAA